MTNDAAGKLFFEQVVSNPRFLYSAFSALDTKEAQALFEEGGCPLKVERGSRVFPVSDHASDVIRALERLMALEGVKIRLHTGVQEILTEENKAEDGKRAAKICGVRLSDGTRQQADCVIVATGGLSYPTTGSTGDGYGWAEKLGHRIVPQSPSLVPFVIREGWCSSLQGLSLKKRRTFPSALTIRRFTRALARCCLPISASAGRWFLSASSYYGLAMAKWEKRTGKSRLQAGVPDLLN